MGLMSCVHLCIMCSYGLMSAWLLSNSSQNRMLLGTVHVWRPILEAFKQLLTQVTRDSVATLTTE